MSVPSDNPSESESPNRTTRSAQNIQTPPDAVTDRVAVSEIMSALDRFPEVREERVREIKHAVDTGSYAVDPLKVAESMLKNI